MSTIEPDRQDAPVKVKGQATYAAEQKIANLTFAVSVKSTVAKGRVTGLDVAGGLRLPGVLHILTPDSMPKLIALDGKDSWRAGNTRLPLSDWQVHHDGQDLAVVVAKTLEEAQYAAAKVHVEYESAPPIVEIERASNVFEPKDFFGVYECQYQRGDPNHKAAGRQMLLEVKYQTPVEHHNPIEPHATIAVWRGDQLTLYDSTQGVVGTGEVIAKVLGLSIDRVRVVSPYLGGGFGCKGFIWPRAVLTAIAARQVGSPVKMVLSREEMFTSNGYRAATIQDLSLTSEADGRLLGINHTVQTQTSTIGDFFEPAGCITPLLYAAPNIQTKHSVARLDTGTPTAMRAPGETSGSFALECAMDELAHELKIDPVALRKKNEAPRDPQSGKLWSGRRLVQCYELGAARFGWSQRNPIPGQLRDGQNLVGFGMAAATYPANRLEAAARLRLLGDGGFEITCATQDLGTGTYTVMSSIVSEVLGVPISRVTSRLGDTDFPPGPLSGGSSTSASIAPAIRAAALEMRDKLIDAAVQNPSSSLHGRNSHELIISSGWVINRADSSFKESFADIAHRARPPLESQGKQASPDKNAPFSFHSFGAHFVEVAVDMDLSTTRVRRVVSVMDIGTVLSPKTARSQIQGGVMWGIGMALMEKTVYDPRSGRIVTRNLADYLIPTHADAPQIDVMFLGIPDTNFNLVGARGMGEIGLVGAAAAIANAVFNATGKRVRSLPITPETLL